MATVATYPGVVKQGQIQSSAAAELPEGSQVVVLSADKWDESALVDPHIARRKANGWLVSYVGSVIAQQPHFCFHQKVDEFFALCYDPIRSHAHSGSPKRVD
jgi:hypothetical protein